MDRELIELLAREAGITCRLAGPGEGGIDTWYGKQYLPSGSLIRFAALVAEECAKAVEALEAYNGHAMPALMHAAEIRALLGSPRP